MTGAATPWHPFAVTLDEARRIQDALGAEITLDDEIISIGEVDLAGGADVAFIELPGGETLAVAVAVTLEPGSFRVVEAAYAEAPAPFPYIPGFLTFREGPAVLAAIGNLSRLPEVMVYDGAGIAHPRGMGIAAHMAALTGIPSIGCAKSRLTGMCETPGEERGDRSYLFVHDRPAGVCLRTRRGVRPVYVSPGGGFSVDGACRFVLSLTGKYRVPEPTRIAHNLVTARRNDMTRWKESVRGGYGREDGR